MHFRLVRLTAHSNLVYSLFRSDLHDADCAVCSEGYGPGADNVCHSCTDAKSHWLIFAGSVLILAILVVVILAVVFLIGGLDAVEQVKKSVYQAAGTMLPKHGHEVRESSRPVRKPGTQKNLASSMLDSSGPTPSGASEADDIWSQRNATYSHDVPPKNLVWFPDGSTGRDMTSASATGSGNLRCCGLRDKIKHWASRVPLNKVKILVVVWQVLTAFPGIAGVSFPSNYSRFLSWIDAVNFDVGSIFSASCIIPAVGFYERLLLATLAPLGLVGVLVITYRMATRRAGIGSASVIRMRAAWSRHLTVGLLLTFLVSLDNGNRAIYALRNDTIAVQRFCRDFPVKTFVSSRRTCPKVFSHHSALCMETIFVTTRVKNVERAVNRCQFIS